MKLLEKEDVIRLGLDGRMAFYVKWRGPSPEGEALDYPDMLAEGPFLIRVNDEVALVSQDGEGWEETASKRNGRKEHRWWSGLLDVYLTDEPITRTAYLNRIHGMKRRLHPRGVWVPWEDAHPWPEGGDLTWSALYRHPWLEIRENDGQREVRYREVPR